MQIIEQCTIAKNPTAGNEDGIVVTNDFIAVIDGSTSKSNWKINLNMSNGRYCMMLISQFISQCRYDITLEEMCNEVTLFVRNHYPNHCLSEVENHPEARMAASCAIYSRHHNEIWMIGDCFCLLNGICYDNPKPYEDLLAQKRAEIIIQLLASGQATKEELRDNDLGRKAILEEMIITMRNQNKTYSVIDGFSIPLNKVKIISLPPKPTEIVLATDGYPILMPTHSESEEALRQQAENDPLNIGTFKATKAFKNGSKSFDDRTYIRFFSAKNE